MERRINFENLFRSNYKPLFRYAFSILLNKEEAEDVVMDTFDYIWSRWYSLNTDTSLSPLMYKICRSRSIDRLRYAKKKCDFPDTDTGVDPEEGELFTQSMSRQEELSIKIRKSIDALPTQCRSAFIFCFIEGKSYKETAAIMGISVNTVREYIVTSLKRMRAIFSKDDLLIFWLYSCKHSDKTTNTVPVEIHVPQTGHWAHWFHTVRSYLFRCSL